MTTERHITVMRLMTDIDAPAKIYRSALRKAWRTATDSDENNAAKDKGNTALEEIEGIVREWVANHPQTDADRLHAASRRALASLDDLIANTSDPGVEALGARYELASAVQRLSPYEVPLDEVGFNPRADLAKAMHIVWEWIAAANNGIGADVQDLVADLEHAGFGASTDAGVSA